MLSLFLTSTAVQRRGRISLSQQVALLQEALNTLAASATNAAQDSPAAAPTSATIRSAMPRQPSSEQTSFGEEFKKVAPPLKELD
mmetsp:Transcript_125571/g.366828  ORF Transcript_125571/g.366828 Transcript_125571/m.366828 type:complete len:85 (+) Transcript_125571:64-318(+)